MKKAVLLSIALIALLLMSLEIYSRRTQTYSERQEEQTIRMTAAVDNDPRAFCKVTSKGRRFVPGSRAVIRNHMTSHRDVLMEINSNGFRGPNISTEKMNGEIRILVMGDSITCGDTLPGNEIFVTRMEEYLHETKSGKAVRVINGGIGDIGLEDEVNILVEQGLAVKPDIVLFVFYMNDSRPPWGFSENLGKRGWLRRHSVLAETVYRKFKFKQWLNEQGVERFAWVQKVKELNWMSDRTAFRKFADMARYDWGAAWQENSWVSVRDDMERVKILSEKYDFKVGFVAFPVAFQVYADFADDDPQIKLEKTAKALGFKYYDLLPSLRRINRQKLFFDHCHPLSETHDLIGKELAIFVDKDFLKK